MEFRKLNKIKFDEDKNINIFMVELQNINDRIEEDWLRSKWENLKIWDR